MQENNIITITNTNSKRDQKLYQKHLYSIVLHKYIIKVLFHWAPVSLIILINKLWTDTKRQKVSLYMRLSLCHCLIYYCKSLHCTDDQNKNKITNKQKCELLKSEPLIASK